VVGLHFFSPANVMRLLEVVRGAKTAPDVLATSMALAKTIKKVAVVSGVCDGFIGNRMLARYGAAAQGLLNAGALPQQVDGRCRASAWPWAPSAWATWPAWTSAGPPQAQGRRSRRAAGSRCRRQAVRSRPLRPEDRRRLVPLRGRASATHPRPGDEQIIAEYRASKGITPRKISDDEVVERCIFALVNEGARILAEGIAARASDIDMVYLNGYGFPLHRGGPMLYADTVGLANVVRALRASRPNPAPTSRGSRRRCWCAWPATARPSTDPQESTP
jgi:3-hydroxyacyl-CoA dehydrogenase